MKTCTKCGESKPLEEFYRQRSQSQRARPLRAHDGRRAACKACMCEDDAQRYIKNRDAIRKRHSEYNAAHRAEAAERSARHYSANRDEVLGRHAEWRAEHPGYDATYRRRRWRVLRDARKALERSIERTERLLA